MNAWADYGSAKAHKLLAPQRENYFAQSAATRDGEVPDYRAIAYATEAMADHPAADELRAAFQFKYGD